MPRRGAASPWCGRAWGSVGSGARAASQREQEPLTGQESLRAAQDWKGPRAPPPPPPRSPAPACRSCGRCRRRSRPSARAQALIRPERRRLPARGPVLSRPPLRSARAGPASPHAPPGALLRRLRPGELGRGRSPRGGAQQRLAGQPRPRGRAVQSAPETSRGERGSPEAARRASSSTPAGARGLSLCIGPTGQQLPAGLPFRPAALPCSRPPRRRSPRAAPSAPRLLVPRPRFQGRQAADRHPGGGGGAFGGCLRSLSQAGCLSAKHPPRRGGGQSGEGPCRASAEMAPVSTQEPGLSAALAQTPKEGASAGLRQPKGLPEEQEAGSRQGPPPHTPRSRRVPLPPMEGSC
ncbi:transcription initiation factor TFIID subunit 4-like [Eublepharis macularius]|uniref:Transcription initiation factor TFIID subunit 4-like n=1 Tax=Eublepharis macularius TaxID=481883 RepID=A0AA97KFT0_EUBMA|nr:transcription initiation factor TFIID subunit 4-like [Eublepharis macularius]